MNFDMNNPVTTERMWMPAEGYEGSQEVSLRKMAVRAILKASDGENFDASIPYLAMTYFDRYISRHPVPYLAGTLRVDLYILSICCLTLAWKARDEFFNIQKFVEKNNLKEVQNHFLTAELAILNGLDWQMRPITALSLVDMVVEKIPEATKINRRFINEIIVQTQGDVTFTRYRPSVIAVSAILSACSDDHSVEYKIYKSLFALRFPDQVMVDLDACTERISAFCRDKQILRHGHIRPLDFGAGGSAPVGGTSQAGQSSQEAETSKTGQTSQIGETSGARKSSEEEQTCEARRTSLLRESTEGMPTLLFEDTASEAGQKSLLPLFGEASEGEEASKVREISGGGEASDVGEISEDLIRRRPGKEPIDETSTSEIIPRRPTVREIFEIEEVLADPQSESSEDMNFELKWVLWASDNPEDLFIDSARFRPAANPAARAQVIKDHPEIVQKCANCNVM